MNLQIYNHYFVLLKQNSNFKHIRSSISHTYKSVTMIIVSGFIYKCLVFIHSSKQQHVQHEILIVFLLLHTARSTTIPVAFTANTLALSIQIVAIVTVINGIGTIFITISISVATVAYFAIANTSKSWTALGCKRIVKRQVKECSGNVLNMQPSTTQSMSFMQYLMPELQ